MGVVGFSINVRLGLWLDDLKMDLKSGLKIVAPMKIEASGLDSFSPELSPRVLGTSGRRDLSHLLRSKGVALSAMKADVGGRRLADPKTLDVNLSRIRESLQLASDVGAAYLVVPAGFIAPVDEGGSVAQRNSLTEAARTLAGMSSSFPTRVCWQAGSESPEILSEFLHSVDSSDMLAVDLNPGAYVMRGIDPLKALNLLTSRVFIARAADHFRGGAEAPFGTGDVRWGELMVGLSTLQRNAPIDILAGSSVENDRVTALSNAYRRLVALRQNPI